MFNTGSEAQIWWLPRNKSHQKHLVAIDVNSGGATKERNIEKTALKN